MDEELQRKFVLYIRRTTPHPSLASLLPPSPAGEGKKSFAGKVKISNAKANTKNLNERRNGMKLERKTYEAAILELILLDGHDIVTASGEGTLDFDGTGTEQRPPSGSWAPVS